MNATAGPTPDAMADLQMIVSTFITDRFHACHGIRDEKAKGKFPSPFSSSFHALFCRICTAGFALQFCARALFSCFL
jgi:hypothetical protein